jgi:hypothetical protein
MLEITPPNFLGLLILPVTAAQISNYWMTVWLMS